MTRSTDDRIPLGPEDRCMHERSTYPSTDPAGSGEQIKEISLELELVISEPVLIHYHTILQYAILLYLWLLWLDLSREEKVSAEISAEKTLDILHLKCHFVINSPSVIHTVINMEYISHRIHKHECFIVLG